MKSHHVKKRLVSLWWISRKITKNHEVRSPKIMKNVSFNMMIFHDIWWFFVTFDDYWWFFMTKTGDLSWLIIMINHDISWWIMTNHHPIGRGTKKPPTLHPLGFWWLSPSECPEPTQFLAHNLDHNMNTESSVLLFAGEIIMAKTCTDKSKVPSSGLFPFFHMRVIMFIPWRIGETNRWARGN